jgi:bifunctional non-homologous end joining protein LigD
MHRVINRLGFVEPQLASPVDQPPEGKHWIHEIKHDGYRCQVLLERGQARVFTRNGYDWSDRFPSIVHAAANLRCQSAIIDGEAIVQDEHGISDFEALPSAMRCQPHGIVLYAFDLMHLNGKDLRQQTLSVRRSILKALIGSDAESRIQFSDEFDGDGDALFKACAQQGLEGIVSKHGRAPYRSGRSKTWLKTKCFTEGTFVIIGTDRDRKTGALAKAGTEGLAYAGAAFFAVRGEMGRDLFERLQHYLPAIVLSLD